MKKISTSHFRQCENFNLFKNISLQFSTRFVNYTFTLTDIHNINYILQIKNSFDSNIQFTYEIEKDRSLSSLNILCTGCLSFLTVILLTGSVPALLILLVDKIYLRFAFTPNIIKYYLKTATLKIRKRVTNFITFFSWPKH